MIKYSKYKSSGIKWLGDIPKHWEHRRLKDYCYVNMGQSPESESYNDVGDGLPFYQGNTDFGVLHPKTRIHCTDPKKIAESNDVLISVRAPVGEMNIADEQCCIGRGLAAVQPTVVVDKFLYYQLIIIKEELKLYVTGSTFEAVSSGDISILRFLKPPKKEQKAIANYLDEKTSKLDLLISNKKAQIKRLKEIRQIEINTAVTKGLDPNVKLKSSGVEWIGDMPEHWKVRRIKDHVSVNVSSLGSDTDLELDIKYLDISNVNNTGLTGEIQELKFFEAPSRARRIVKNGDVVMSTVRPYLKAITYLDNIPKNMIASTGFAVMTSKSNYNSKFLFYQTVSDWFNETINSKSVGASYPALNNDVLVATKILFPPLTEQLEIANYLDNKTSKIDQLVSNLEKQINQLQEIRKIEIYNAVTGKIKVA